MNNINTPSNNTSPTTISGTNGGLAGPIAPGVGGASIGLLGTWSLPEGVASYAPGQFGELATPGGVPDSEQVRNRLAESQKAIDEELAQLGMTSEVDPLSLYLKFVDGNPAQRMLDQLLSGEFPPELLEGPAGQIHLMMIQNAMQARTNFMNMLSNIMKKNDEAASTAIGNMR